MGNDPVGSLDDDGDDFCYAVHDAAWLLCADGFCRPQMDESECGTYENGSDDGQFENPTCRQIDPSNLC